MLFDNYRLSVMCDVNMYVKIVRSLSSDGWSDPSWRGRTKRGAQNGCSGFPARRRRMPSRVGGACIEALPRTFLIKFLFSTRPTGTGSAKGAYTNDPIKAVLAIV